MFRVLLASIAMLAVSACRAPNGGAATEPGGQAVSTEASSDASDPIKVRVEFAADPALGVLPVVVYVLDDHDGVTGASVKITGDMTHAGMAPVLADAVESEPGLYRADDFAFTMAGDWILTTDIVLPDGTKRQVETRVNVPGG